MVRQGDCGTGKCEEELLEQTVRKDVRRDWQVANPFCLQL